MIISNRANVRKRVVLLIGMMMMIVLISGARLMLIQKPDTITMLLLAILIVLMVILPRLEMMEFENSGLVVSMKRRGILSSSLHNQVLFEVPLSAIQDIELSGKMLQIKILTENIDRKKIKAINVSLKNFSHLQRQEILESLKITP